MRPRLISGVPGLKPDSTPFERLEQFARMIVSVPKKEADKETAKAIKASRRRAKKVAGRE